MYLTSILFVPAGSDRSKSGSAEQANSHHSDQVDHSPPPRWQTSKGVFLACKLSPCMIVFFLKEEVEARVDVLSSPSVTNSTRVHSRHHLNRPVRESFLYYIILSLQLLKVEAEKIKGGRTKHTESDKLYHSPHQTPSLKQTNKFLYLIIVSL